MIQVLNVSKSFAGRWILRDINLRFQAAQTHVLLGASGSGKSTLLRMIMGLLPVDQGEIRINDTVMSPITQRSLARKIGYVLQSGGLFPHLTAADNVTLVARTLGWEKNRISARMEELLSLMELEASMLSRFPTQLSGGQRQRVGVMRAAFLDPDVMLLDEPLGALDPIVRARLQQELKKTFNKLKKLVLIVTHDIGEAAYFGHSVTLLHEGRVLQHGTFPEMLAQPKDPYVTEFIQAQRTLSDLESSR